MLDNFPKKNPFRQLLTPQRIIALVIFLSCLALYLWLVSRGDHNLLTPAGLKATFQDQGIFSAFLYMAILALSVIVSPIPGAPLVVAGGAIWGLPQAGIYSIVGGLVGGLVAYFLGRVLGASTVEAITRESINLTPKFAPQHSGWLIFFTRLFPILPFGFISYGAGIAKLPAKSYAIGTLFGMTPPTLLLSYFGESLTTSLIKSSVIFILLMILLVGVPFTIRKFKIPFASYQEFFHQFTVSKKMPECNRNS